MTVLPFVVLAVWLLVFAASLLGFIPPDRLWIRRAARRLGWEVASIDQWSASRDMSRSFLYYVRPGSERWYRVRLAKADGGTTRVAYCRIKLISGVEWFDDDIDRP